MLQYIVIMETDIATIRATVEQHFPDRAQITPVNAPVALRDAVNTSLELLEAGTCRVAEPTTNGWQVNEWLKMAVLLYFRLHSDKVINGGATCYFDRVPPRFTKANADDFIAQPKTKETYTNFSFGSKIMARIRKKAKAKANADFITGGFRVVPPATVRRGAHVARDVVLMPRS